MAINYTWDVKTVDTQTIDGNVDTVFNVHWKLTGKDENENTAASHGTIALDTSDLSDFIPFSDLTASKVQGWVETAIGEDEIQNQKDSIALAIENMTNPPFQTKTLDK